MKRKKIDKPLKASKKVLVIDDDQAILEVVKIMLDEAGYNVETASDYASFHASVSKCFPDVILSDIWMPGFDIYGVDKYLKNKKDLKKHNLIVFSALGTAPKVAKEIGADGLLAKPFEMEDLLKIVEKYIGKP